LLTRWTWRRSLAALALLAVLACALCASTYRIFGNFWDEPEHIAAGLVLIDRGEYRYDVQHPPLARLAAAIGPYLAGARFSHDPDPIGDVAGQALLYHSRASYDTLLTLARVGMLPFLLLLLGSTFLWMRHWYGDPAALLALVFLVSCPVLLGHASLVALDVPVTALIMASLYLLLRWFETPTLARGTALGVACGLAVATKMSAIPFIGVASLALGLLRLAFLRRTPAATPLRSQWAPRLISLAPGVLLGLCLLIGVYGDRLVYLTTPGFAPSRALDFYFGTRTVTPRTCSDRLPGTAGGISTWWHWA
jgi:dolichyl-phosphate-mannose--protein O-mannosyl transferase